MRKLEIYNTYMHGGYTYDYSWKDNQIPTREDITLEEGIALINTRYNLFIFTNRRKPPTISTGCRERDFSEYRDLVTRALELILNLNTDELMSYLMSIKSSEEAGLLIDKLTKAGIHAEICILW